MGYRVQVERRFNSLQEYNSQFFAGMPAGVEVMKGRKADGCWKGNSNQRSKEANEWEMRENREMRGRKKEEGQRKPEAEPGPGTESERWKREERRKTQGLEVSCWCNVNTFNRNREILRKIWSSCFSWSRSWVCHLITIIHWNWRQMAKFVLTVTLFW